MIEELLQEYRTLADKRRTEAGRLRSGEFRLSTNKGSGWVDISIETAETYERQADELERIVAAYEKRRDIPW